MVAKAGEQYFYVQITKNLVKRKIKTRFFNHIGRNHALSWLLRSPSQLSDYVKKLVEDALTNQNKDFIFSTNQGI